MGYHHSFTEQCIDEVLESLSRLITTTKIKVLCNLGVWCISMQQVDASLLSLHFDSLLRSVVHSIDNPVGSLSTTFEGLQAVMKLGTQVSGKMRDSSSIWAPQIYRRLLSADKRERDMCQRCLLKIKSIIIPPQQALSKGIAHEMKLSLLPAMKELLKQGKKIQALQAWRWFICILGYDSLKSRHLLNELLKVPEETFSDSDPQVQIATLVAWEGLIDALVALPSKVCDTATTTQLPNKQDKVEPVVTSEVNGSIIQTGGYSKGLKLIMTPLIGIMASKTDFSVQSSCVNTWYYLLHKLDSFVNDPHILGTVVEPIFKTVFSIKLDDKNIWMWRVCMDLLHDFIRSKSRSNESHTKVTRNSSPRNTNYTSSLLRCSTVKTYTVKWLAWDSRQMNFLVRMIEMTLSQAAVAALSSENNILICDVILRMFHFFLKGIHMNLAETPTSDDIVKHSINAVVGLVKTLFETAMCVDGEFYRFQFTCLRSVEAALQELDPSFLGSHLYKIPLDVEFIRQSAVRHKPLLGSVSMSYMDMVLPVSYITVLYYYVVVQGSAKAVNHEFTLQDASSYLNSVLSSYELLDILHAISASLYACVGISSLKVWITVAHCLGDHLNGAKDLLPVKIQPTTSGSQVLCKFLIYPLVVCSSLVSPILSKSSTSEEVMDCWMLLYNHINCSVLQDLSNKNWFTEDLCSILNDFLHQQSKLSEGNSVEPQVLLLCCDVGKCILENLSIEKVTPEAMKCNSTGSSGINYCLQFIARLMNLVWTKMEEPTKSVLISRLLVPMINVVSLFQWKDDIASFVEVLGDLLLPWMSDTLMNSELTKDQVSLLWVEFIRSLHRSWPSIEFDSFLKFQAPLLEKTLEHPNPSISDPTINFWNSAYGDQIHLDIPPSLSHVLDKLYRLGKIKLRNSRVATIDKDNLSPRFDDHSRHKATSTMRVCSKRVELVNIGMAPPCPKRKMSEFTEQREVRRAQQGKSGDCSGHGPGIRIYTDT